MRNRRGAGMTETALHFECIALMNAYARPDCAFWHTPNGEKRDRRTATKLRLMGVRAGVPDIAVLFNGALHFIELKTGLGIESKSQVAFREHGESAGAHFHLAHSLDEFIGIVNAIGALRVRLRSGFSCEVGARTPEATASGETSPNRAEASL